MLSNFQDEVVKVSLSCFKLEIPKNMTTLKSMVCDKPINTADVSAKIMEG